MAASFSCRARAATEYSYLRHFLALTYCLQPIPFHWDPQAKAMRDHVLLSLSCHNARYHFTKLALLALRARFAAALLFCLYHPQSEVVNVMKWVFYILWLALAMIVRAIKPVVREGAVGREAPRGA